MWSLCCRQRVEDLTVGKGCEWELPKQGVCMPWYGGVGGVWRRCGSEHQGAPVPGGVGALRLQRCSAANDPVRKNFTRLLGFPPVWFAPLVSQTPSTSVCKISPLRTCSMYDEQLQAALEDFKIASEGFKCIGRNGAMLDLSHQQSMSGIVRGRCQLGASLCEVSGGYHLWHLPKSSKSNSNQSLVK